MAVKEPEGKGTWRTMVERVQEIAGVEPEKASQIIVEIIKLAGVEPAQPEYGQCDHTSKDMIKWYAETGHCAVCAHERNVSLETQAKRAKRNVAGAMIGGLGVAALATASMTSKYTEIIRKFGRCSKCGISFSEKGERRVVGCGTCKEAREWLKKRRPPGDPKKAQA